jgi:hypothetical protein
VATASKTVDITTQIWTTLTDEGSLLHAPGILMQVADNRTIVTWTLQIVSTSNCMSPSYMQSWNSSPAGQFTCVQVTSYRCTLHPPVSLHASKLHAIMEQFIRRSIYMRPSYMRSLHISPTGQFTCVQVICNRGTVHPPVSFHASKLRAIVAQFTRWSLYLN